MAEFKLGRIRFVWKNDWATGTTYYKDDIVAYGGKTYLCVAGHASAVDFYTDLDNVPTKWNQFSDGQEWKGDWSDLTLYKENDIVKYGGYVYICNNGHTSQTILEDDQSSWDLFAESFNWESDWVAGTIYKVNDVVKYGGYTYLCNTPHTAAATDALGLENDQSKWDIFSKGVDWKSNWVADTRYKVGDLVKFGGTTYMCNLHHTSAATDALGLEADQSKWDYFNAGTEYTGQWTVDTRYKINDLVKNGGGIWICTTEHTSDSASFTPDAANWAQFVEGLEFEGDWNSSATYQNGDIVRYGGNSYIAKTPHDADALQPPSTNTTDWDLFSTGFRFANDWDSGTLYKVGEVIRNGGFTYVAIADSTNQQPPNITYWSKINEGIKWKNTWTNATAYVLGDAVKYGPNSYICILAHTAATGTNRPDVDISGTYWNLLTGGNEESVLTDTGDIVFYSGAGPTRLAIGDEGSVLTVQGGIPEWSYFGRVTKVFYVAGHGTDSPAPTYGLTIDQPWATVRYALEQIEKGAINPNAGYLLTSNRTFIQKEITEWVNYQIANPTGIWAGFTNDNQALCERDMGLIVDAIVYDLTHTGNTKSREAAESYFTALGALIPAISDEEEQLVEAINYGVSLISSVLANTAPAANYQTLNGISAGDRIKQIIDADYTAEAGTTARCTELAAIITDAVSAASTDGLPTLDEPGNTVNVKTGQFNEVLPMIVPANTAIVGDELRGTRISPAGKLIPTNDKAKSIETLQYVQSLVGDIVTNTAITPLQGSVVQDTTSQRAATGTTATVTLSNRNIVEMKNIIENGESSAAAYVYPNPTGYGAGYSDARRLILANKSFIQDEIQAYMVANYGSLWTSLGVDGQAACTRDVGYIVEALGYDLTYGETSGCNLATVIAARAYYVNGVFVEPSDQKTAALAVQTYLKSFIDNIATKTTGWGQLSGGTQITTGSAGSAGAAAFAQARIQEVYDTIDTGTTPTTIAPDTTWVDSTLVEAKAKLDAGKTGIQYEAIAFVNKYYVDLVYNEATCARDVGYIVDAIGYDMMFGSNFLTIQSALAYRRGIASAELVLASQLAPTLAVIDFTFGKSQEQVRLSTVGYSVIENTREMRDILVNDISAANAYVIPDPAGYDTGYFNARRLIVANKTMIKDEVEAYMLANYNSLWVSLGVDGQAACKRDIGYIVDALQYDLTYGGNLATVIAARSYYSFGTFVEPSGEKTAALAVQAYIKTFIDNVAQGTEGWGKLTATAQDTSGTAGSSAAAIFAQARIQEVYDAINTGTTPTTIAPSTAWVSASLVASKAALDAFKETIKLDAVAYIKREYPTLVFDEDVCSRDVGYIVDALGYDLMFGSNFLSIQSGMSYRRGITSTLVVVANQLDATVEIINFIGERSSKIATIDAANFADDLFADIITYAASGGSPLVAGTNIPTTDLDMLNGAQILKLNKEFLAAEATAYIAATFTTTITSTSTTDDTFVATSTAWMTEGDEIRFTGTVFGGISTGVTYYVKSVVSSTAFTVSETLGGATKDLSNASGTMTVSYYYATARCENDVKNYVDAIAYDMMYTGNYKTALAARFYRNALTGSKLEDMFLVRNGCGVRNQTLTGLDGSSDGNTTGYQDALTAPNEFGTQRPRAGSYVSLDPGWGPNDSRAWVTNKSTYVQNVTTFGTGCVGQKIDGALHNGGNDSIVSNDFTQVLSDGIGAWVTNLGRAELVSVFTYYNHIGYLAENGGKIRATNGNNSYGTFGSVAEGVDVTETPITGVVDNRNSEADIRNVLTDGSEILALEFRNAGSAYTSAASSTISISGAGTGAANVAEEFRDGAVFQVRMTDPGDSSGPGGTGYITSSNAAQGGNATSITLAVADNNISSAYVGMSIYITSGVGAGQFGYITAYNAGNKVASVSNESTGSPGWEHVVSGTPILSALDITTTYTITPRIVMTAPSFSSTAKTLPSSSAWKDAVYGNGVGIYTGLTATGSVSGSLATFDVSRVNGVYSVELNIPGVLYAADEVLTILGTALGGTTPANDLTITINRVNSPSGSIAQITATGTAISAKFVAIASGTTAAAYSLDGLTWSATAMPSSLSFTSIAYGPVNGVGYYVAIASGTSTNYYSTDGINWSAGVMSSSTTWSTLTYGNGRFVAVATGTSTNSYSADGGATWSTGGALPASTTWTGVTYGKGIFVAVASGGTQAASSSNGGLTWTSRTLPASKTWTSVTFGSNMFMAVAADTSIRTAYSINGTTWTSGDSLTGTGNPTVGYGQGVFFIAQDNSTTAHTSDTGLVWTSRTLSTAANPASIVFGNPNGSGVWVSVATGTTTVGSATLTGARAKARAYVSSNQITEIWIREPGSGYTVAPTLTITDPNNTGAEAATSVRIGNGALAQPTWTNRGSNYLAAAASITGDGYADNYQVGTYIGFKGLTDIPKAGANVQIAGIDDIWYRLVSVSNLLPSDDGTYTATIQVSPPMGVAEAPEHETGTIIRRRYSQVRLTGHDFLDIGTGNFTLTNYPGLPFDDPIPANETVPANGGRVFYTSTDQDGNFRVGGLFNVEQATGIATLNADAFNIAGLNELSLGSVALGGSGATISEFSTDPFFTQDSDSVIPTQRAIKAYITSQIGGGGSSLNVNTLTAGVIYIAGQQITTTTNVAININTKVNFKGGIVGDALVLNYFLLN